jgi:hypothetical protein
VGRYLPTEHAAGAIVALEAAGYFTQGVPTADALAEGAIVPRKPSLAFVAFARISLGRELGGSSELVAKLGSQNPKNRKDCDP